MTHDSDEYPPDLQPVADALRDNRAVADGHVLERVLHRVRGSSPKRRRSSGLIPRLSLLAALAVACVIGANLNHLNVVHGVAQLAGALTKGSSTSTGGSAAQTVYCPPTCATPLTPGYWKNHQAQTTANLPQKLGNYTVSTFSQAQAVFGAMNCSISSSQGAFGCLAGQLLAAELNVRNGAPTPACATTAITSANNLLSSGGYVGPTGTYTLTATQRSQAVALANTLNNYNNHGSC